MFEYIQKISNKVAENLVISYLLSFITSTALFSIIMLFCNWDIRNFVEVTSLLILVSISGVTMKFLSGFGLIITYATISSVLFRIFSTVLISRKTGGKVFKIVLLEVAGLIFGYGVYILIITLVTTRSLTFIEKLIHLVFGVWSLIILVYLIPVIQGAYRPLDEEGLRDKITGKFVGFKYSLWSGYQSRIRKDYGEVYAAEYERYKTDLEDIRDQLSGLLLLPFMFILLPILPLMGVAIILWLRLFSHNKKPFIIGERILISFVLAGICITSTFVLLFVDVAVLLYYFNISYAMGIFSGVTLLVYIILKP